MPYSIVYGLTILNEAVSGVVAVTSLRPIVTEMGLADWMLIVDMELSGS